jgi:integrase
MASLLKPWVIRYLDAEGHQVPKGTPGARKVKERAKKWYAQYVDQDGRRKRTPLCSDKTAARQMLATLEREVQLGKAGLVDSFSHHRKAPIATHVAAYEIHLRDKGVTAKGLYEERRKLRAVIEGCGFKSLADLRPEAVEIFLATLAEQGAGSSTRNHYLGTIKAFARWCFETKRMGENVLGSIARSRGEIRRRRRALTEDELVRLIRAARARPLQEVLTIRSGKRRGERVADTRRPETRARVERLGWERSLIYKTLVFTGLRRGELDALQACHLKLDGPRPHLALPGAMTKNGEIANLPLRQDLAEDLRRWLEATGKSGTDQVLKVNRNFYKVLRLDLKMAGIPYKDQQGRTIDVHALRHTTATCMSMAKVTPRVAQRHMRHSDIRHTLQTYTDVNMLDEAEALAALPNLPLQGETGPLTAPAPGSVKSTEGTSA